LLSYLPKYFTTKSIYLYVGALFLCNLLFLNRVLPLIWWCFGIVEVIVFFYYANLLTKEWVNISNKDFVRKLFIYALVIRITWVIFSYFFYSIMTGQPFEFSSADAIGYHGEGIWLSDMIEKGDLQPFYNYIKDRYSDMGYTYYLGWQYWITGGSVIIARFFKALFSAYMCILVFKLGTRNFGNQVGRIAAIFCMLMPNLIYYTGLHTKEVEMVLITVFFVERSDYLLRTRHYNFVTVSLPLLLVSLLFLFRTVLGATALFSFFSTLVFSSNKLLSLGKRTVLIIWVTLAVSYFIGGKISSEVEETWASKTNNQNKSLEFRTNRDNGNKLAKYASSAIFVPMIFVIPLPTLVNTPSQENQQMINGGNFVKNILSFFVLFSIYWVVKNKQWREYILIGSFTIGYLLVIANSAFAQSERFHQPALPFLLIMAAFGVSKISNSQKKYFTWYMIVIFIAIVLWSWYKLAGRGLV
jgi:hypothetical protein